MRRCSVAGSKLSGNRRRSSAGHTASTLAGRRCSLSTFNTNSRGRSSSRGHVLEDDVELGQPSSEDLPLVAGYEDLTFEPYTVPPLTAPILSNAETEKDETKEFKTISPLSASDARQILIRYADSRCIFNKDAARDMKIMSMKYQPRHKYTLESFTESRQISWSYEPYSEENVDEFVSSHTVKTPWSIEISPPSPFQLHTVTERVPHTDVLMTCHGCGGVGSKRCNACSAAGWERCSFCLGDGHKISLQGHRERCFRCLGTGRKKCWKCGGDTIAVCRGCGGTGQIRCFIALTIICSNHLDSRTVETPEACTKIDHKLEYAKGIKVFEEIKPVINPVCFPDNEEIHSLSASLIAKHEDVLETEKLLLQKHSICTIPVYYITYEWKQRSRCFYIYGVNNEVYAPDYPEELCCFCNMM